MNDSTAVQLIAQIKAQLQNVSALTGKIVQIYDDTDLLDAMKGISPPFIGIVYEGMRAMPESGTMRRGVSAEAVFSLVIVEKQTTAGESQVKNRTINLLDATRQAMREMTRATAGHQWRFVLETPADAKKSGNTMWIQRWTTPVQLV
jgi:hypothetical protein